MSSIATATASLVTYIAQMVSCGLLGGNQDEIETSEPAQMPRPHYM